MNGNNKKDLKAFVRYDGSGRVVAGSLILRRKKPKVGKWTEIQGYQCCNLPIVVSTSVPTYPVTEVNVSLTCDTSAVYISVGVIGSFATVGELVSALNMQASAMGTFSVNNDGININLNPSAELVGLLGSCSNDLILSITEM